MLWIVHFFLLDWGIFIYSKKIPCKVNHRHPEQSSGREHIGHAIRFGLSLIRIHAEPFMKEALRV
jgi:hypothetical protein